MSEEDLEIKEGLVIPGWELWFTATRSGGPGGQHANKTSSRVTLHWSVAGSSVLDPAQKRLVQNRLRANMTDQGVLQITVSDTRSQHRNRMIARQRLAQQVQRGLRRRKRRIRTGPSRAQKRKRLEEKRHRAQIKKMRKPPKKDDW